MNCFVLLQINQKRKRKRKKNYYQVLFKIMGYWHNVTFQVWAVLPVSILHPSYVISALYQYRKVYASGSTKLKTQKKKKKKTNLSSNPSITWKGCTWLTIVCNLASTPVIYKFRLFGKPQFLKLFFFFFLISAIESMAIKFLIWYFKYLVFKAFQTHGNCINSFDLYVFIQAS